MVPCCRNGIGTLHACTKKVRLDGERPNCIVHGGGPRCPGKPGLQACPLGNGITVGESDRQVSYIKDGVQYCCACFCEAFPDDERTKNAKRFVHAKEQAGLKWVMDRRVSGTRRRPDHRPLIHLLGTATQALDAIKAAAVSRKRKAADAGPSASTPAAVLGWDTDDE